MCTQALDYVWSCLLFRRAEESRLWLPVSSPASHMKVMHLTRNGYTANIMVSLFWLVDLSEIQYLWIVKELQFILVQYVNMDLETCFGLYLEITLDACKHDVLAYFICMKPSCWLFKCLILPPPPILSHILTSSVW